MSCFFPWKAFRHLDYRPGGDVPFLTTNPAKALNRNSPITLPCNRCNGCISDRQQEWGTRCVHEAKMHQNTTGNSFITLTLSDEHYPDSGSLTKRDWQLFMKRLRREFPHRIRFFMCSEYGDKNFRAHFHALLFGEDFRLDRKVWRTTKSGPVYRSATLEKVWPYGQSEIGTVTMASARYCAGYIQKKLYGAKNPAQYEHIHPVTGSAIRVEPEFALMSNRPGIGHTWFEKYKSDAFPSDFIVVDGQQMAVPRYYLRKLTEEEQKPVKRARARNRLENRDNNTTERLMVRAEVHDRRRALKERPL